MRIGSIRCVVTSVLVCIFVLGMLMGFPRAKGLDIPIHYIYSLEEIEKEEFKAVHKEE